jgi:predicted membrane protein
MMYGETLMFSYQRDKTGFFATLVLLIIALGAAVATTVLIAVGAAQGDWSKYLLAWKWVVAGCWIGCIVTVLVRIIIFRQQMLRAEKRAVGENNVEGGGDVVRQK